MSNQKYNNPKTITIMAAAATAGISLAVWSVHNAMAPPPAAPAPAAPVKPASPTVEASARSEGSVAATDKIIIASATPSEDSLSLGADPFVPFPVTIPAPIPAAAAAGSSAGSSVASVTPLPSFQTSRAGSLTAIPFGQAGNAPVAPPIQLLPDPELVGTLLGDRPCAVFRTVKKLTVVPVGGRLGDWMVVSVSHDSVSVKSPKGTLRLVMGLNKPQRPMRDTEEPIPSTLQARTYVPSREMTAFDTDTSAGKTSEEHHADPLFPPESAPPSEATPPTEDTLTNP